ncbi:MAG: cell division protein ZapA [Gammaproteobacteria bacterium]|nr:cell division protein ZapA [Gammaproteobacteria bacterium]
MSADVNTVKVNILDKDYQVSCPAAERDALVESARYLDQQMRTIRQGGKVVGVERIAVMAALNITHGADSPGPAVQPRQPGSAGAGSDGLPRASTTASTASARWKCRPVGCFA